jgi:hypothetical protein
MYVDKPVLKLCSYKICLVLILLSVVVLGCKSSEFLKFVPYKETVEPIVKENPLLLNSGVINANEAEVSLILWSEKGDIPQEILANRPMADWVWTSNTLGTEDGKVAKTIFGKHLVNKNEENILFTWYTTMARDFAKVGGKIYFDERVPQIVDVSAYLSKINALPSQCSFLGNMVSVAAYNTNLKTDVRAGQDRINIQLLSRGKITKGQSVLAMPALLEEF